MFLLCPLLILLPFSTLGISCLWGTGLCPISPCSESSLGKSCLCSEAWVWVERLCWFWGTVCRPFSFQGKLHLPVWPLLVLKGYFDLLLSLLWPTSLFRLRLGRQVLLLGLLSTANFKKEDPDEEKRTCKGSRAGMSLTCLKSKKRVSGARQSGLLGEYQRRVGDMGPDVQPQRLWVLF